MYFVQVAHLGAASYQDCAQHQADCCQNMYNKVFHLARVIPRKQIMCSICDGCADVLTELPSRQHIKFLTMCFNGWVKHCPGYKLFAPGMCCCSCRSVWFPYPHCDQCMSALMHLPGP
jgi:hypothetical protein